MLTAAGAALAAIAVASPAWAAGEVTARISGLNSTLTAGGRGDGFTATLTNNTKNIYTDVRRVMLIQMGGLTAAEVHVSRSFNGQPFGNLVTQSMGAGVVRIVDESPAVLGTGGRRGASVNASYQLSFDAQTPAGQASMVLQAYSGQSLLANSDPRQITIKSSVTAFPTDTPSAPPPVTDAPTAAADSPAPQVVLPTKAAGPQVGDFGLGWPLYIFGALMVLGGGAALYFLVIRKPPTLDEPGETYGEDRWTPTGPLAPPSGPMLPPSGRRPVFIGPDGPAGPGHPPTGQAPMPGGPGVPRHAVLQPTSVMPPVPPAAIPTLPTVENPSVPPKRRHDR
jgi:hypothetical protein